MPQTPQFTKKRPDGDTHDRMICDRCGFIDYVNPKIVVGSVISADNGKIVMCRRAIEPRSGFWTIPAGYLEVNETTTHGAEREAWEEACARITITDLLAVYNIPRISQVQLIYRARLAAPDIAPGQESLEVGLFEWNEIPWDELAFPSVHWALDHFDSVRTKDAFAPFTNPPGDMGNMMPGQTSS